MNPLTLRPYMQNDLPALCAIWNEVVAAGDAFPQEDYLTPETGAAFFAGQSYCGVACDEAGQLLGLYILHPNNVGRCGHLCNAATPSAPAPGAAASAVSWSATASTRPPGWASGSCSSTPSS